MSFSLAPQEEATIRAFIVRERRDRFLEPLPNPKQRHKITESLAHPNPAWFESHFLKTIPASQSAAAEIAKLLHSKGAGKTCWAISEDRRFDGREVELDAALADIVGYGMGCILCCVPGKLAFVESENGRFIMER